MSSSRSMESFVSQMPVLITVKDYPSTPSINLITSDKFSIGRCHDSSLKIMEKAISRKHCTIEKTGLTGWTITSHSRNAVSVNSVQIPIEHSKLLECGDIINLVGVRIFRFKCSIDANNECRCDNLRKISQFRSTNNRTEPPILSSAVLNRTDREVPVFDIDLPPKPEINSSSTDFPSLNLRADLPERCKKFGEDLEELIAEMIGKGKLYNKDFASKIIAYLKQIDAVSSRPNEKTNPEEQNSSKLDEKSNSSSTTMINLVSPSVTQNIWSQRNELLIEKSVDVISRQPSSSNNAPGTSLQSELKNTDTQINMLKEENSLLKDRITYFEKKFEERETQLEHSEAKNEHLENEIGNLRQKLRDLEVSLLELNWFKEMNKYREDDKRNKDELEKQIASLKSSQETLKKENAFLLENRCIMKTEIDLLKQKILEAEEKLTNSLPIIGASTSGEFCCNLKDKLIDLLEKEYSCCICGDFFIDATVTNCNHVFCAYCLDEWKKKKKSCPFCRANTDRELKANVIDNCINSLIQLVSNEKYEERLRLIQERKKIEGPPKKRRKTRGRGAARVEAGGNYSPFVLPLPDFRSHGYIQANFQNFLPPIVDLSLPS